MKIRVDFQCCDDFVIVLNARGVIGGCMRVGGEKENGWYFEPRGEPAIRTFFPTQDECESALVSYAMRNRVPYVTKKKIVMKLVRNVRFRRDSDEKMCGGVVEGSDTDLRFAKYGGIACCRRVGHAPPCIGRMDKAAKADGVCGACRTPIGQKHRADCDKKASK